MHGSPQTGADGLVAPRTRQPSGRGSSRFARSSTATPSRASTGSISSWKPLETTSGWNRSTSSSEPGPHAHVLDQPRRHLVERRPHRRELGLDHLVQRQLAAEVVLGTLVDAGVAELEQHHVEAVHLRHRPVPVEDEPSVVAE